MSAEQELAQINRYSLMPLAAEDVFVFRVAACDTRIDRDFECFNRQTLEGLAQLYPGKSMIMDHAWSASKQTARIYAAEVEEDGSESCLILRAYMLRNEQTAPTISAIEGGILREVSVGCSVERRICGICGKNKADAQCDHRRGRFYNGQQCHVVLDGAKDAYELSFVAVPAQRAAGVVKEYGSSSSEHPNTDQSVNLRLRMLGFSLHKNEMEELGND